MSAVEEEPLERIARLAHDAANRLFEADSLLTLLAAEKDAAKILELAGQAGQAIASAVEGLREIGAEARAGASVRAELGSILRAAAPRLARALGARTLPIRAGEREVAALRRVIESLVLAETAQAAPHRLELAVAVAGDGTRAELRFHSAAPARDEGERASLLDPARLRNPESLGGGVSYAAAATLLARLGGAMRFADDAAGRSLVVDLPLVLAAAPPARPLTVLVVDDEPGVARAATLLLETLGHRAVVADTVASAKRRLEAEGIDALLVDRRLGAGGDGADLVAWVRAAHPELRDRTVVASGAPGPLPPPLDDVPVLAKPFDLAALAARFGAPSKPVSS